jgi:hypothetical protein
MTYKLVTNSLRVHQVEQFVESIAEEANTVYFAFVGGHSPYSAGDAVIDPVLDSVDQISANVYQNMIFGKKINSEDVIHMVNRVDWEANTVYTMYEHDSATLFDENFFVVVDEGAFKHVYKCLYNNNDGPSTVQPTFASSTQESDLFDDNDGFYGTSDGYQWKYMYSIPTATYDKFSTSAHIPVVVNTSVTDAAVNGAIDVVKVTSTGARYDNYFRSVFADSDLRVTANIAGLEEYSNRMYSLGDNRSSANIQGDVSVINGQTNVIGNGTLFTSSLNVGDYIQVQNTTATETKRVSSITNNTLLEVASGFSNTFTAANVAVTYPYAANPANDFYNYCILKITSGTGAGQFRNINDYVNDGARKIVVLDTEFTVAPDTTSNYEVSPSVLVFGNGTETTTCEARALINATSSNSVYAVEILERGEGYILATANVKVSNVVGVTSIAELKPILSPPGGHGSNVKDELVAHAIGISITLANNESGRITTDNDYRQIGIIKNPAFANVELNLVQPGDGNVAGAEGSFLENEVIRQFTMTQINGTISVNTTSSNVVVSNCNLQESVRANDCIIVKSGNNWFIANTVSVTNTSQMQLTTNSVFTNSAAFFYKAQLEASAQVETIAAGLMYVTNKRGFFLTGQKVMGMSSYAVANVANVQLNNEDISSGIATFRQMRYYTGTKTGTFVEDETIFQTTANNRTAVLHSSNNVGGVDYIYVTDQFGEFDEGSNLAGSISNAVFTVTNKYNGDILPQSGEVIYVQNGPAVSRSNSQTEKIKIVIEY